MPSVAVVAKRRFSLSEVLVATLEDAMIKCELHEYSSSTKRTSTFASFQLITLLIGCRYYAKDQFLLTIVSSFHYKGITRNITQSALYRMSQTNALLIIVEPTVTTE